MLNKLSLYWQTIKKLTFSQLLWRFVYTVKRKCIERCGQRVFDRIEKDVSDYVNERCAKPFPQAPGLDRTYYKADLDKLLHNEFTFLNQTVKFGEEVEWHRPEFAKGTRLWKLTINYHEYLIDVANKWKNEGVDSKWGKWFECHVKEWMRHNPLGTKGYGFDNWNSYALSLRIVSWIRVCAIVGDFMSHDFKRDFVNWLAVQSRFLGENIEYDILGNHIVKNWKALMWAGTFFGDKLLLEEGRKTFVRYVSPQFTKSGMHEELSPMYAAIVLGDIHDVMAFGGIREAMLLEVEKKLSSCLGYLSFGNDWARFNDSCFGMALPPDNFKKSFGSFAFDGYVGGRYENWQWMADCGAPVVGRQPGHAHCDALSFEFGRMGDKIFTNAGVYEYNPGERRVYSRSSVAHNTLSVEGHEQHEMWKAFRCGRLGNAQGLKWSHGEEEDSWSGAFVSFDESYRHKRKMTLSENKITCDDDFSSVKGLSGTLNFHLTPGYYAKATDNGIDVCRQGSDVPIATMKSDGESVSVVKMPYFPEYGREVMSDVVRIAIYDGQHVNTEVVFI